MPSCNGWLNTFLSSLANLDITLKPSRWVYLAFAVPISAAIAALWSSNPGWPLTFISLGFILTLLYCYFVQRFRWTRVRFSKGQVVLWEQDQRQVWHWQGEGRRGQFYLDLALTRDSDDGHYRLRIWRDSVSDSSWRALNAYIRVFQSQAGKLEGPIDNPF